MPQDYPPPPRRSRFEERTTPLADRQESKPRDPAVAVRLLEAEVEALKHELSAAVSAVTRLARGEPIDEIPQVQVARHQLWTCSGCGARLGYYDKETDVLAVHYRDAFWWVHVGAGGWFKTVCRSCCTENRLDSTV